MNKSWQIDFLNSFLLSRKQHSLDFGFLTSLSLSVKHCNNFRHFTFELRKFMYLVVLLGISTSTFLTRLHNFLSLFHPRKLAWRFAKTDLSLKASSLHKKGWRNISCSLLVRFVRRTSQWDFHHWAQSYSLTSSYHWFL